MKKLLYVFLLIFLIGCADTDERQFDKHIVNESGNSETKAEENTEAKKLSSYDFNGFSFKLSDIWQFDEEWLKSEYYTGNSYKFFADNNSKNGMSIIYDKIAPILFYDTNTGKTIPITKTSVADIYSLSDNKSFICTEGKWETKNEIDFYREEITSVDEPRNGIHILIPMNDEYYYQIIILCDDEKYIELAIEDIVSSWDFDDQQVLNK